MDTLTQFAIKYGADKWGKHHYTPVYDDLFADKRNMVRSVLEIGTAEGASLFMWRDYFPNATIYGGEIDQKRVDLMKDEERIRVFQCDQSSVPDLQRLIENIFVPIDFVVDDGSHRPEDQLLTCRVFMGTFPKNIIYVIEDVADMSIFQALSKYNPEVADVGKRYDDKLIIIKR